MDKSWSGIKCGYDFWRIRQKPRPLRQELVRFVTLTYGLTLTSLASAHFIRSLSLDSLLCSVGLPTFGLGPHTLIPIPEEDTATASSSLQSISFSGGVITRFRVLNSSGLANGATKTTGEDGLLVAGAAVSDPDMAEVFARVLVTPSGVLVMSGLSLWLEGGGESVDTDFGPPEAPDLGGSGGGVTTFGTMAGLLLVSVTVGGKSWLGRRSVEFSLGVVGKGISVVLVSTPTTLLSFETLVLLEPYGKSIKDFWLGDLRESWSSEKLGTSTSRGPVRGSFTLLRRVKSMETDSIFEDSGCNLRRKETSFSAADSK